MDTSKTPDPKMIVISRVDYLFNPPTVSVLDLTPDESVEVFTRTAKLYAYRISHFQGLTCTRDLAKKFQLDIGTIKPSIRLVPVFDPEGYTWQNFFLPIYLSSEGCLYEVQRPLGCLSPISNDTLKFKFQDDRFRMIFLKDLLSIPTRAISNRKRIADALEIEQRNAIRAAWLLG